MRTITATVNAVSSAASNLHVKISQGQILSIERCFILNHLYCTLYFLVRTNFQSKYLRQIILRINSN